MQRCLLSPCVSNKGGETYAETQWHELVCVADAVLLPCGPLSALHSAAQPGTLLGAPSGMFWAQQNPAESYVNNRLTRRHDCR